MKSMDRPIIFSGPMVQAILDGRKTQTRRPIKSTVKECTVGAFTCVIDGKCVAEPTNVEEDGDPWTEIKCFYGAPGDRLWVRESFIYLFQGPRGVDSLIGYKADNSVVRVENLPNGIIVYNREKPEIWKWKPSIHMPRWASRITLEIADLRVERLQDITEQDARAEGPEPNWCGPLNEGVLGTTCEDGWNPDRDGFVEAGWKPSDDDDIEGAHGLTAVEAFQTIWASIYAKKPGFTWADNPWVWVIEFRVIT